MIPNNKIIIYCHVCHGTNIQEILAISHQDNMIYYNKHQHSKSTYVRSYKRSRDTKVDIFIIDNLLKIMIKHGHKHVL